MHQPIRSSSGNLGMLNLRTIAAALGGDISNNQVLAPGPGHSREDRSLSIRLDPNAPDGFLVHSFANDDVVSCKDHVRQRLNLPAFQPNGQWRRKTSTEIENLLAAAIDFQRKPEGTLAATHRYVDHDGTLLYQVRKYTDPKRFVQRRPDGKGGWIYNLQGQKRVIYRWPNLLEYPDATVLVTEGEKDADRGIEQLKYPATTVASGKWTSDCVEALRDRDCWILEDNDATGRAKALDAAKKLHGTAASIRIIRLPGLAEGGDISDWLDAGHTTEEFEEVCYQTPDWTPDDTGGLATPAEENNATAAAAPEGIPAEDPAPSKSPPSPSTSSSLAISRSSSNEPLPFICVTDWHNEGVPEREWAVLNRIPKRNVTLFSGEGAIGKSIVSLHLGVAHVLGRDWLGTMPEPGPALIVACEDDADELHRRLAQILDHYSATFADLKEMYLMSLAGQDALLAVPDRNGLIHPTKLFERLHQAACDSRPKLIVLDNSADVFGGNENDRTHVRQFIGILRGLAINADAGILLTSHPSLTGISSGTGLSGSTAWNASVRSRLWMKRATTEKNEEPDPNLRVIEVMKANYGPVGETMTVRWKEGVFVPVAAMGTLDKLAAERAANDLFLKLLDRFAEQGRNVSDKPAANNYAPKMFATDPDGKGRRKDLTDAMARLFSARKIRVEDYGRPSRPYTRLVRCG
jgi:RecA-family ATPase